MGHCRRVVQSKTSAHRPVPPQLAIELGEALRSRRQRASLTQEQLAAASQVSVQMIRRLESASSNPTLGTLHAIAIALGTSVPDLFWVEKR